MDNIKNHRVLDPLEFSGSIYSDYGYEINGVKSTKGYVSRYSAKIAMWRMIEKQDLKRAKQ